MLINLSNHPAYKEDKDGKRIYLWKEPQLKAAALYGEIRDMEFPNISPDLTTEDVYNLAEKYLNDCEKLIPFNEESAIHITGEVTFCFYLIQMLLKKGYKCISATSERNVIAGEDGEKVVRFDFKRFREYKFI